MAAVGLAITPAVEKVKAENGNSIAAAPLLTPGVKASGSMKLAYRFFYRVDLSAGDQVEIDFESSDPDVRICLYTYDPSVTDYTVDDQSYQYQSIGWECTYGKSNVRGRVPVSGRWTIELAGCGIGCNSPRDDWTYGVNVHAQSSTKPAAELPLVMILGDSYAAGVGTQTLPVIGGGCHQADAAWPNLLPYPVVSVACSGARISALFSRYQRQPSQASQLKEYQPDIALAMIGGNDVGFAKALDNCFRYNCAASKLNPNAAAISTLDEKLTGAYVRLARTTPKTKLVVVGYPRIFPSASQPITNCGWLSRDERLMLDHMATEVNAAIQAAVHEANSQLGSNRVLFASTWDVLGGHELCSSSAWVFKLSPFCLKDARCGHPTAPGQEAIAREVRSYLKQYLR